jgi:hypothetical protein
MSRRAFPRRPGTIRSLDHSRTTRLTAITALSVLIAACGGGGGGGDGGGGGGGGGTACASIPEATVTVSGQVGFERVPFSTNPAQGLDYAAIRTEPARELIVEVLSAANQAVLASTTTDANGRYTASVDSGTRVFVRAKAQTRRAAPGWDVRVLNNTNGNALYVLDSSTFCTDATSITRDLTADSGWPGFGGNTYSGTRASAPFAILDSIYRAVQFVRANGGADLDLPALSVYWSPDNRTSDDWNPAIGHIASTQTLSVPINGFQPGIYVLGEEGIDTDEFDGHVLVHEFMHVIEDAVSRTESPGGAHSLQELLDMRLAFSEGFANAFSAMVLDDPIYRDSWGTRQGEVFEVDLEDNFFDRPGFFSEGAVQSLVWDLYDAAPEATDGIQLGFAPMLEVFTDELRNGPALTSLYAFAAALKQQPGAPVAAIDALLQSRQVFGTDEYGSGETYFALVPVADPVYSVLTVDGPPVRVCTTDATGSYNKLGNRVFLRFSLAGARDATIRAEYTAVGSQVGGPTPDPDIVLYRAGYFADAMSPAANVETLTMPLEAGDYVVEVYEYSHVDPADVVRRGVTCMNVSVS